MFDHNWLLEEDYKETIKTGWESTTYNPTLICKLNNLSTKLSGWAKHRVGTLSKEIKITRNRLNLYREVEDSDIK